MIFPSPTYTPTWDIFDGFPLNTRRPGTWSKESMVALAETGAAVGVTVSGDLPIEIDPAYAVDAADLASIGLALGAE